MPMSLFSCTYHRGGVLLPALGLWLDASRAQRGAERVFVSHAHSDHIAAHRETILSPATASLMRSRLPGRRTEHKLDWGISQKFHSGPLDWNITLFPAGHILGSAMARIEAGGESLLYTGDFKLRKGPASEGCHPVSADILIMETTFGRPVYRFPPTEQVLADIHRFCQENLDQGITPVLLGYSLGKSQEMLAGLVGLNRPILVHPQIAKLNRIYEDFGHRFPAYSVLSRDQSAQGCIVLCPPGTELKRYADPLGPHRKAVLTGWALHSNCRYRHGADAAFPLSDHADYQDLHAFVRAVNPREVLTLHGFASDFAQSLRNTGFAARSLSEADQLHLPLELPNSE